MQGGGRTWLVTGAAGFIGCNVTRALVAGGDRVIGLDNFLTGDRKNVERLAGSCGIEVNIDLGSYTRMHSRSQLICQRSGFPCITWRQPGVNQVWVVESLPRSVRGRYNVNIRARSANGE